MLERVRVCSIFMYPLNTQQEHNEKLILFKTAMKGIVQLHSCKNGLGCAGLVGLTDLKAGGLSPLGCPTPRHICFADWKNTPKPFELLCYHPICDV